MSDHKKKKNWWEQNVFPWQTIPETPAGVAGGKWTPFSKTGYPAGSAPKIPPLPQYTQWLAATPEFSAREELRKRGGVLSGLEKRQAQEAIDKLNKDIVGFPTPAPDGWEDYWDDSGYLWKWDKGTGKPYKAKFDAREVFLPPKAPREDIKEWGNNPYDDPKTEQEEGQFNPITGEWEPPANWISPYQQRQLDEQALDRKAREDAEDREYLWQQDQLNRQLEAQKQQQLSNLRANPASWLEYASLAGQTPVIPPWMLPLMQNQQQNQVAGQPLPGWTTEGSLKGLPELTRPSANYMSRIAPSQREQYYGYEQARTGATPTDTQWRLWSSAPPSGGNRGLRRYR